MAVEREGVGSQEWKWSRLTRVTSHNLGVCSTPDSVEMTGHVRNGRRSGDAPIGMRSTDAIREGFVRKDCVTRDTSCPEKEGIRCHRNEVGCDRRE